MSVQHPEGRRISRGVMFLENVGWLSADYTLLHPEDSPVLFVTSGSRLVCKAMTEMLFRTSPAYILFPPVGRCQQTTAFLWYGSAIATFGSIFGQMQRCRLAGGRLVSCKPRRHAERSASYKYMLVLNPCKIYGINNSYRKGVLILHMHMKLIFEMHGWPVTHLRSHDHL
jgi:hypothetical protein